MTTQTDPSGVSSSSGQDLGFWRNFLFLHGCVEKSYRGYAANGQQFLYAKLLRRDNEALRQLIFANTAAFPPELEAPMLNLVHHLDVWRELWDHHAGMSQPGPLEAFAFANAVTFPRNDVEQIAASARAFIDDG